MFAMRGQERGQDLRRILAGVGICVASCAVTIHIIEPFQHGPWRAIVGPMHDQPLLVIADRYKRPLDHLVAVHKRPGHESQWTTAFRASWMSVLIRVDAGPEFIARRAPPLLSRPLWPT